MGEVQDRLPSKFFRTISTQQYTLFGSYGALFINSYSLPFTRFFRNKGAVAGVFLIVGLAAASIFLFLFFFIRRRRRTRRLEHDTAVASTLAAAGFNRAPLDGDDDDDRNLKMRQTGNSPFGAATLSSIPSASHNTLGSAGGRPPSGYMDDPVQGPSSYPLDFDPYAAYGTVHPPPTAARKDGYMPARTGSPPPGAAPLAHSRNHSLSSSSGGMMGGHTARESAGSFEPLLHAYRQGSSPPDTPGPTPTTNLFVPAPDVPPRNPARSSGNRSAEGSHDGGHVNVNMGASAPTGAGIRDSASSVYSEADDQLIDLTPTSKLEVRGIDMSVMVMLNAGETDNFLRFVTYLTVNEREVISRESRHNGVDPSPFSFFDPSYERTNDSQKSPRVNACARIELKAGPFVDVQFFSGTKTNHALFSDYTFTHLTLILPFAPLFSPSSACFAPSYTLPHPFIIMTHARYALLLTYIIHPSAL